MAEIAAIITAIFKAIPALAELARIAVSQFDKAREADALRRKTQKDSAVDEAIDNHPRP